MREAFPTPIDSQRLANVFHLGFHSAASFGAVPYLLAHPDVTCMIDCPRFNSALAARLEALRLSPQFMLLTHIDDVGDQHKWKARFPEMKRVMHAEDIRGPVRAVNVAGLVSHRTEGS